MEYSEVTSSPLDIFSNSNLGAAKAMFLNSMQRFLQRGRLSGPGIVMGIGVFVTAPAQARSGWPGTFGSYDPSLKFRNLADEAALPD
jgi:hypothetical protein